jgi:hypothetical protein
MYGEIVAKTLLATAHLVTSRPAHHVCLLQYPCRELQAARAAAPNLEAEVFALLQQIDTKGFLGEN